MDIESNNEMKYLFIILIIEIIPISLYGSDQDSSYQSFEQQIIQLKQQVESLDKQVIRIEPVRDYTSHLIMVITIIITISLIILTVISAYFVPKDLRRDFDNVREEVTHKIKEIDEKINTQLKELELTNIKTSELAHRTMYKITLEAIDSMLVVWGGRWLHELIKLQKLTPNQKRLEGMREIINETFIVFEKFNEPKLKELAEFENLGGIKDNYRELVQFGDEEISAIATNILSKINSIQDEFKKGDTYFWHPGITKP